MAEKILVVDDDLDTLRLVGMMLERQGFNILAASSGQQALNLARTEKPDLVVLDLMIPDIDGIQVARQLRADPRTREILILMFTAKTQTEDKLEGFDAGADDYLTKPIQPRELLAHVRAVLKRKGSTHRETPTPRQNLERGVLVGLIAPKGGLGLSTVTLNTGIALHSASRRSVIVADFRPGCGTIGLELGLSNPQGLNRLLALDPQAISTASVEAELVEHLSGIKLLLSSSEPLDAQHLADVERFRAIAEQLPYLAHFTLLDLGPSLTLATRKIVENCQQVILVFEPVGQTIQQARLMHAYLVEKGFAPDRITPALVNRQRAGMQLSLGQAQDQFGKSIPLVFTAAPELAYQAQISNMPMILRQADGVAAQQFTSLSQRILVLAK